MTFSEITEAFEAYTGVSGEIDDSELAIWYNEAQIDLALDFGRIKTAELVPDENGLAAPPADNIMVVDANADYSWTSGGLLKFKTDAPVEVYYRAMPDPEHVFTGANPNQTPDLPYSLHYLLALFAASRYWDRESEGDTEEMNLANKWWQQYQLTKKMFLSKMNRAGNSDINHWVVIP